MKKYSLLIGVLLVAMLSMNACRSSKQACAAYSQAPNAPAKTDIPG